LLLFVPSNPFFTKTEERQKKTEESIKENDGVL